MAISKGQTWLALVSPRAAMLWKFHLYQDEQLPGPLRVVSLQEVPEALTLPAIQTNSMLYSMTVASEFPHTTTAIVKRPACHPVYTFTPFRPIWALFLGNIRQLLGSTNVYKPWTQRLLQLTVPVYNPAFVVQYKS